jgi:DNA-binding CsgD family transcriptional regulator
MHPEINELGYHCRDYFVKQWDRFKHLHWGPRKPGEAVQAGGRGAPIARFGDNRVTRSREGRHMPLASAVQNVKGGHGEGSSLSGVPITDRAVEDVAVDADDVRLLALLADGLVLHAIARHLDFSERTVRRRIRSLCDRMGVDTPMQAVVWAVRVGVL